MSTTAYLWRSYDPKCPEHQASGPRRKKYKNPAFTVLSPVWNIPIIPDLASLNNGSYAPDSEKPEQGNSGVLPAAQAVTPEAAGGLAGPALLGLPWYAWGILAWITGGILFLCWNLILHAGVRSVVHHAVPADRRWTTLLDGVAEELELQRNVRLLESGHLKAAVTVGIVAPVIVLPTDCDEWTASRRAGWCCRMNWPTSSAGTR